MSAVRMRALPTVDIDFIQQTVAKYRQETDQSPLTKTESSQIALKCLQNITKIYLDREAGFEVEQAQEELSRQGIDRQTAGKQIIYYMVTSFLEADDERNMRKCMLSSCKVREGLRRCTGCFKVAYCSEEHQRLHAKEHLKVCEGVDEK